MARVADISRYNPGDDVPVNDHGKVNRTVKLPEEFYRLNGHGFRVDIWIPTYSETDKESAFSVEIGGVNDASLVKFTWGLFTGIATLSFRGVMAEYQSTIPEGFTIDDLVELLTVGSVQQFVLDNARLTKNQVEFIRRRGL
jgi:hypothetical protein